MSAPRKSLPAWADYGLLPFLNLFAALVVAGLVVMVIGEDPLSAMKVLVKGALGSPERIGYTLYYATNFIFTGLAVAVAYHAGLFNIGAEGQATVAGIGVILAGLALQGWPWWAALPFVVVAAMLFGAAWAFIPAYLQARRGSHIVITTIMFNYLAFILSTYLLVGVINDKTTLAPETVALADETRMPFLSALLQPLGLDLGAATVNPSLFVALAACGVVWLLLWHTRFGFRLRTVGLNPVSAVYAGMNPARIIIVSMLISGALAGLMAVNEVFSVLGRLQLEFTGGAGFIGIAVALMGRNHPVGIVLAAFLFGMLYQGGAELAFENPKISRDMIVVIQGLVILFAGGLEHMFRPMIEVLLSPAPAQPQKEA